MKLISRVTCTDEVSGCDYALIDLTPALARLGLKRVAMLKDQKRIDKDLDEMYFWDYHAEYFNPWIAEGEGCGDTFAEAVEEFPAAAADWMAAPADFTVPEPLFARMECCQMIVRENAIAFVAIPKHTDFNVSTAELSLPVLEAAAAEGTPSHS